MLCEKCGKANATTHIKTVVNGVMREMNLCGHCAAQEGYTNIQHNSLAGMLASMFGEISSASRVSTETRCPVCGAAFSDIAKNGRMGCSECYSVFKQELLPYLK